MALPRSKYVSKDRKVSITASTRCVRRAFLLRLRYPSLTADFSHPQNLAPRQVTAISQRSLPSRSAPSPSWKITITSFCVPARLVALGRITRATRWLRSSPASRPHRRSDPPTGEENPRPGRLAGSPSQPCARRLCSLRLVHGPPQRIRRPRRQPKKITSRALLGIPDSSARPCSMMPPSCRHGVCRSESGPRRPGGNSRGKRFITSIQATHPRPEESDHSDSLFARGDRTGIAHRIGRQRPANTGTLRAKSRALSPKAFRPRPILLRVRLLSLLAMSHSLGFPAPAASCR